MEIISASADGNISLIKELLKGGADVNVENDLGMTPLTAAAGRPCADIEILRYLIDHGALVNHRDRDGRTALHHAVSEKIETIEEDGNVLVRPVLDGFAETVKFLVSAGADIEIKDQNGKTPLASARENGHIKCASILAMSPNKNREFPADSSVSYINYDLIIKMKEIKELKGEAENMRRSLESVKAHEAIGPYERQAIILFGNILSYFSKGEPWTFTCRSFYHDSMGSREEAWTLAAGAMKIDLDVREGLNDSWQSIEVERFVFSSRGLPGSLTLEWNGEAGTDYTPLTVKILPADRKVEEGIVSVAADLFSHITIERERFRIISNAYDSYCAKVYGKKGQRPDSCDEFFAVIGMKKKGIKRLRLLLEMGIGPELYNSEKEPAIITAAGYGETAVLDEMLGHGADIDARDNRGRTALLNALHSGNGDMAEFLIEKGADINAADNDGNTPLLESLRENLDHVTDLLISKKADIGAVNNDRYSILMCAAARGNSRVLQLCLDNGADVNLWSTTGYSALNNAIYGDHAEMALTLIEAGAEVDHPYSNRTHPLCLAAGRNHVQLIGPLLDRGSDIEHRSENGFTPLIFAAYNNAPDALRRLLEAGADIKAFAKEGKRALDYAVENGHGEIVEILESYS